MNIAFSLFHIVNVPNLQLITLQAVAISEASPAWQDYVDYVDAIVLDGLKQACFTSLKSMLNQIIKANMDQVLNTIL